MALSRSYSSSPLAAVRRYFSLSQHDLARYLGVSQTLLAGIEGGRRGHSSAVLALFDPLVAAAATTPTPPPAFGTPDPGPLAARLDYCQHHTARLRRELRPLETQAAYAGRWAAFRVKPACRPCHRPAS